MKIYAALLMVIVSLSAVAAPRYNINARAWYNDQDLIEISSQPGYQRPAMTLSVRPGGHQTTHTLNAAQLFQLNSAQLQAPSPSLQALEQVLRSASPQTIILTGHTDSTGNAAYNLRLSEQRAQALQRWVNERAPQHHYIVTGRGDVEPIAPNTTRAGRAQNRRVTITFQERPH